MTKDEAIQAMQDGKTIHHYLFASNEWMAMRMGMIILEDGVVCTPEEFWQWRTMSAWDEGYEVIPQLSDKIEHCSPHSPMSSETIRVINKVAEQAYKTK